MVKRRGTRRGAAGDDVTETEQFQEDVVAERIVTGKQIGRAHV